MNGGPCARTAGGRAGGGRPAVPEAIRAKGQAARAGTTAPGDAGRLARPRDPGQPAGIGGAALLVVRDLQH